MASGKAFLHKRGIRTILALRKISPEKLSFVFIIYGIAVRLTQYLYNRSLWADEANLALNIVERSYFELFQPLDYDQGAPVGFLLLTKLVVQLSGNNEYALRLFPFLGSTLSLILLYQLARRCLSRWAVPMAIALFASLEYLVYYSFEFKQYATDVFFALLISRICLPLLKQTLARKEVIVYSLVGAIALWFSHPAIFVLAGVGLTTLLHTWNTRNLMKIKGLAVMWTTWLLSFVSFYRVSLSSLNSNRTLMESWSSGFPKSSFDIVWALDALGKFFYEPLGFVSITDGIAIFAFVIGCVFCFYHRKHILLLLLSPLLFTILASYLHKFPFRGRLVLFLTPFIILLIAEGIHVWIAKSKPRLIKALGIVALLTLIVPPFVQTTSLLRQPYYREEIKPILSYIQKHQQPEELLYIYQRGIYQFLYYAPQYGYQEGDYILGVDDLDHYDGEDLSQAERARYEQDIDALKGQKVWFLFSHAHIAAENEMMKTYLDQVGAQLNYVASPGAFAYLYDLS